MAKKLRIKILENTSGVEFIQIRKGKSSRNITPTDLDFGELVWEEVKAFYRTNLHYQFIKLVNLALENLDSKK